MYSLLLQPRNPTAHLPCTLQFLSRLRNFVVMKIDPLYRDPKLIYYITCNHYNPVINYLNMQSGTLVNSLIWIGFRNLTCLVLNGGKKTLRDIIPLTSFLESITIYYRRFSYSFLNYLYISCPAFGVQVKAGNVFYGSVFFLSVSTLLVIIW